MVVFAVIVLNLWLLLSWYCAANLCSIFDNCFIIAVITTDSSVRYFQTKEFSIVITMNFVLCSVLNFVAFSNNRFLIFPIAETVTVAYFVSLP